MPDQIKRMNKFNCIGIQTRLGEEVKNTLKALVNFLEYRKKEVLIDHHTAELVKGNAVKVVDIKGMAQEADLIIVIGGDGTMLGAARDFADFNVPLLGVNRGRLGFLTDISPDEIETRVGSVIDGEYTCSERFLLEVKTIRGDKLIGEGIALNDVVLHPGKSIRMMELELYIDKQFVYSQRSDGLIVSTPTGSTAYALSAGGPIMHPKLNAMVLVPMNAHTLTSRPIAISGDSSVDILVGPRNEVHPLVTCDGQQDIATLPGDVISIKRHPNGIRMLHPADHNFYEICRSKLGWGSRLDTLKDDVN